MIEDEYWKQIEQYFVKKRGSTLILSPKDWPLISSWQEQKIPLEIIYEGIDKAFLRFEEKQLPSQHRTIRTLSSCKQAIEEAWRNWQERNPQGPESPDYSLLSSERRKLAIKLRSICSQLHKYAETPLYQCIQKELVVVSEILQSYIPQLEQTESEAAMNEIKRQLRQLEQQLTSSLEQAIDDDTRQTLYTKAKARLASHKHKMDQNVYEETLHLAFLQELHKTYPLPSFL